MSVRPDHKVETGIGAEELEKDLPKPDFNRGAGGEPLIPDVDGKVVRHARMSSFGDCLEEKSGLNNWLVAKALEGAAKDQSILARVIAASPYEDNKSDFTKLRQDAIQAGRGSYKADIGIAVHAMSERWELEDDYDPGGKFGPALQAYSDLQKILGLQSQLIECHIVNDTIKGAGTADRLYELTRPLITPTDEILLPGTLIIGDLKTGDSLEYSAPGYAVQLAGYAGGTLYDVVNNVRIPTPTINQKWAIIMHLNVEEAHCEFIWVDLEVGRFGARLAEEVREWRRAWRRKAGYKATWSEVKVATIVDQVENILEGAEKIEALQAQIKTEPEPPDIDNLEDWVQWCRARLDAIRANDEAKAWMLVRWPEKLSPPKRITEISEAQSLDTFLARVEAEFGMTFVAGQPVEQTETRQR